jgi:pimeloyl-ACP methyl ester carboxylesterase
MKSLQTMLLLVILAPWVGILPASEAEWMTWDFDGETVAYRLDGAGPPVVQIHGIGAGASSAQTRYQIDALVQAGYRVYSIDLIGWGRSIGPQRRFTGANYVDMLGAFLTEVVLDPAALVGHSLGGTYAIAVAADYPEQVTALVLNAPVGAESFTAEPGVSNERLWERFVSGKAGQTAYATLGSRPSIRSFCRNALYVDPSFCDAETIYDYLQYTRNPDSIYAAASFLTGNLGLDVRDDFAALQSPALLIWGVENTFTPTSEGEEFLTLNAAANLIRISPGGALVNDEAQVRFDELMIGHLRLNHPLN